MNPPEKLYKYCKPEYNLAKGCKTIHLGTTKYYQSLEEKSKIGDRTENRADFKQNYDKIGNIEYHDNIFLEHDFPNSLIFCASQREVDGMERFEASDHFVINDPVKFGEIIYKLFKTHNQSGNIFPIIPSPHFKMNGIRGPVVYKEDKYFEMEPGKYAPQGMIMNEDKMKTIYFTKPERFGPDFEYRYAFWPYIDVSGYDKPTRQIFSFIDNVTLNIGGFEEEIMSIVSTS